MNDGMIGLLIGLFMGGTLGAFLSALVIAVENCGPYTETGREEGHTWRK